MESEVLLANFRGLLRPTVLPTSLVKDLTPDERQIVEFLMALSAKPKVLILAWASEKTEYALNWRRLATCITSDVNWIVSLPQHLGNGPRKYLPLTPAIF
jgi:hypothetical protein